MTLAETKINPKKQDAKAFTIIVDTREQLPFLFKNYEGVTVIRKALKTGDYSIGGFENKIVIERKAGGDYLSSITHDRDRFESELTRLAEIPHTFIVIEDELANLIKYNRNINVNSILGTIASWEIKYNTRFHFMRGRELAEAFIYRIFYNFLRTVKSEDYHEIQ